MCQRILHEELESPLRARSLDELGWYFEQCRLAAVRGRQLPTDDRFQHARHAFDGPRFQRLYHQWLRGGQEVLEQVNGPQ